MKPLDMSKAVKTFNRLNGSVIDKNQLKKIIIVGNNEGQKHLVDYCENMLKIAQEKNIDKFEIETKAIEQIHEIDLPGICEAPDYLKEGEVDNGLSKAVSSEDIYTYVTELIINTIEETGGLPWQKDWAETGLANGEVAYNYISKKEYRGINFFVLNFKTVEEDGKRVLKFVRYENPAFLTFNQVTKLKGRIKKGASAYRVFYFTKLYKYEQAEPKLYYATYNYNAMVAFLKKNKVKISLMQGAHKLTPEEIANQSYLPILKYYNVFNAGDIEGIDFEKIDTSEFKNRTEEKKIEIAEQIVKNFPSPPKIKKGPSPVYLINSDTVAIPSIEQFDKEQSYYNALFHELIHSTGAKKRLNRKFGSNKNSTDYAKEELIAEMGAVYLCAESGILFATLQNNASYLNSWNKRLAKSMKADNKLFFRASSASQAAADHILNKDENGTPAYRKNDGLKGSWHAPGTIEHEALTDCGRLKKGYYYAKGGKIKKAKPKQRGGKKKNFRSSTSKKNDTPAPNKKKVRTAPKKKAIGSSRKKLPLTINYPVNQIKTNKNPNEAKVKAILDDFDLNKLRSIKVYENPDKRSVTLIEGVDRLEAIKRLKYDNAPVEYVAKPKEKESANNQLDLFGLNGFNAKTPFQKQLLKHIINPPSPKKVISIGYIDSVLINFPIYITWGTILKATSQKNDHKLNYGHILELKNGLNNPLAIFKSKTKGYVYLTPIKDLDNKLVIAPIHIYENLKTARVASLYSRSNTKTYLNWINEGLAIWVDEKSELYPYYEATIAGSGNNSQDKNTKTKPKSNKKGLKSPATPTASTGGKTHSGESCPPSRRVLKASDVEKMDFDMLELDEGWENLFQDAPVDMKLGIFAQPKNGKTAGSTKLAAYLTKFGSVLYNFADQGINSNTKKLIKLSGLGVKGGYVTTSTTLEDLHSDIKALKPRYCFIDMINDYIDLTGIKPHEFKRDFILKYPETSFSFVFEATKNGQFKGDNKWMHLVDNIIDIEDFIMTSKGRYGSGNYIIWHEEAKKRQPNLYAEITKSQKPKTNTSEVSEKKAILNTESVNWIEG